MLDELFVRRKILDKKYVEWYKELYDLAHDVMHGNVKFISGRDIDHHIGRVEQFEKVSRKITARLIKDKKIIKVEKK